MSPRRPSRNRRGSSGCLPRLTPFSAFLALAVAVAALAAVTTDGFLTLANLKAILFSGSFVGIAAVGTTVLMLSGNLFSLSLGTTISVGAIAFLSALHLGLAVAIVLTLLLGLANLAAQGRSSACSTRTRSSSASPPARSRPGS